jgi:hypothetical protein
MNCFILVPIALIALILYLCFTRANRYVPEIKVTVSEDGGKTYTGSLKSIPRDKDVYVKCEVSVKANGLLWWFFPNIIQFSIKSPVKLPAEPLKIFELCDYAGLQKTAKDKSKKADKEAKEMFFVAASNKPKKTEIIFKLPKGNTIEKDCVLTLSFNFPINFPINLPIFKKVYNKMVTLSFTSHPAVVDIGNIIVFGNLSVRTNLIYERRNKPKYYRRRKRRS